MLIFPSLRKIYLTRLKAIPVAFKMEQRGITLSGSRLERLKSEYAAESERCGRICRNIAKSYGVELDLPKSGNNNALKSFIFDNLGLPTVRFSKKTGDASLDKTVIGYYEETLPPKSKALTFIKALKAKRKRDTSINYMDGYQRYWKPINGCSECDWTGGVDSGGCNPDGSWINVPCPYCSDYYVLHPNLNITGTDTLRWSSNNPNEQNIGKQEVDGYTLRYCFGPAPGREWWSLDAKNIELRIPAYESGEAELIDLFERPDDPPYYGSTHLLNFHTIYPDIWEKELSEVGFEKVGPHCKEKYESTWYQWCKNGGFAVQYGAIDREDGTADRAFHRKGSHARLKARFSKLEALNRKYIDMANRLGYVETIPDKSVCPERGYPLLCSRSQWGDVLPTVPLNYHVQSTAMWWMMKAMIRCQSKLDEWRKTEGFDGYIVMQVHDELVFDFPAIPNHRNLKKVRALQRTMERGGDDIGIPTPVSCKYHAETWAKGEQVA